MRKQNIYERLSDDMASYYEPTVKRLSQDILGGDRPPWQRKLSPEQQRQFWYDLPDQAEPGQRSKMSEWQEATPQQREQILLWEAEKPAAPATDAFGQRNR